MINKSKNQKLKIVLLDCKPFTLVMSHDVWLAEITGGPDIECDGCQDYTYDDLIDDHVPAIIGGVIGYTGESRIQYVGHSNGGRSMLDTLSAHNTGMSNSGWYCNATSCTLSDPNWIQSSFGADPVETFVGVAVPGNFTNKPEPIKRLVENKDSIILKLEEQGKTHISPNDIKNVVTIEDDGLIMELFSKGFSGKNEISMNLFKNYIDWMNNTNDNQPGIGLNLDNFVIIEGSDGFLLSNDNDYVVSIDDEMAIYQNIIHNYNKYRFDVHETHSSILGSKLDISFIKTPITSASYHIIENRLNKLPTGIREKYHLKEVE